MQLTFGLGKGDIKKIPKTYSIVRSIWKTAEERDVFYIVILKKMINVSCRKRIGINFSVCFHGPKCTFF